MGRIVIRPEDLARLGQRFDAVGDDVDRSHRLLQRSTEDVALNRDDDRFPVGRFLERASLVQGRLDRLADGFRADAALFAQTASDGELQDHSRWFLGLLAGWNASAGRTWATVASGLRPLMTGRPGARESGSSAPNDGQATGWAPLGRIQVNTGGLFALVSRAVHDASATVGAFVGSVASDAGDGHALWGRIAAGLGVTDEGQGGNESGTGGR